MPATSTPTTRYYLGQRCRVAYQFQPGGNMRWLPATILDTLGQPPTNWYVVKLEHGWPFTRHAEFIKQPLRSTV